MSTDAPPLPTLEAPPAYREDTHRHFDQEGYDRLNHLIERIARGDQSAREELSIILEPWFDGIVRHYCAMEFSVSATRKIMLPYEKVHDVLIDTYVHQLGNAGEGIFKTWSDFSTRIHNDLHGRLMRAARRQPRRVQSLEPSMADEYEAPEEGLTPMEHQELHDALESAANRRLGDHQRALMQRNLYEPRHPADLLQTGNVTKIRHANMNYVQGRLRDPVPQELRPWIDEAYPLARLQEEQQIARETAREHSERVKLIDELKFLTDTVHTYKNILHRTITEKLQAQFNWTTIAKQLELPVATLVAMMQPTDFRLESLNVVDEKTVETFSAHLPNITIVRSSRFNLRGTESQAFGDEEIDRMRHAARQLLNMHTRWKALGNPDLDTLLMVEASHTGELFRPKPSHQESLTPRTILTIDFIRQKQKQLCDLLTSQLHDTGAWPARVERNGLVHCPLVQKISPSQDTYAQVEYLLFGPLNDRERADEALSQQLIDRMGDKIKKAAQHIHASKREALRKDFTRLLSQLSYGVERYHEGHDTLHASDIAKLSSPAGKTGRT